MIRLPGEGGVERPGPRGQVLVGTRVQEVDADVVEPRRARRAVGGLRIGRGVRASEPAQERVVQRLDAEREPCHPGRPERAEAIPVEPLGIGLERDLGVGREPEPVAGVGQDGGNRLGRQERRRAAPEEEAPAGTRPAHGSRA